MNEREAVLAASKDDGAKHLHAFIEFLNFLEIYSAAINARLFIGVAREIVQDKILDSIVVLEQSPHWHEEIEKSRNSKITYKHLFRLSQRHGRTIVARKGAARSS